MVHDVCVYTRISNDPNADTEDGGRGVARQEQDCRDLARRQGWRVAHVYSDNDVSAFSGATRPEFEAMLDAIKRGEYDALVCWHTDRLYRSMRDMERVIEVCEAADVPIRSVNGGDLDVTNATGKAVARILGSISRMESEHKAERQKRANVQRAQAGGWWSSNRPFGYTQDGTIREDEAAVIRQAAADVLAGVSMRAIARRLNEDGIPSSRGAKWNGARLRRMLCNPRYAGLRTYHGKVVGPGNWPAILDADDHHGLVAILSDTSRITGTVSYERKYVGTRRYVCGHRGCTCGHLSKKHVDGRCAECKCRSYTEGEMCGAPMEHCHAKHADGRRFDKYRCTASAHLARSQPELDAHVDLIALSWLRDEKRIARILGAKKNSGGADPKDLRTRRAALAAQKDELATLFTEGVLDGPAVRRESAKLSSKIATIDAALADLARRSPLSELVSEGMDTLEQRWADLTPDLKGKIIDELFTVVVKPANRGRYFDPDCIEFQGPRR